MIHIKKLTIRKGDLLITARDITIRRARKRPVKVAGRIPTRALALV